MKSIKNKIGIIGLGYVGLPLLLLINKKQDVVGFDIDQNKIDKLKKNKSYISDVSNKEINQLDNNKIFNLKKNLKQISYCEYLIICLPTPLKRNMPDMSYIKNSVLSVLFFIRKLN